MMVEEAGQQQDNQSEQSVNLGGGAPGISLEITASRLLTPWMIEQQVSFVFTSYQSGKLFFVGLQPDGKLSIFERTFNRCVGLHATPETLFLSTLYQIYRFDNVLPPGGVYQGYDRLFVPQVSYITGDIDAHDIQIDKDGKIVFVNTLFSCLATVDEKSSFIPLWKPEFITKIAAEDRCHLNGLAMKDGVPKYVTAVSKSDANEAWRDHRNDGGIVIDVEKNKIVVEGLSMPHSPRWYQDKLWLLDSGTGYLGYVEFDKKNKGTFKPLSFCPGYLRGLSFINNYAIIGLSKQRQNHTFSGLELDKNLSDKNIEPRCGLQIVDISSGDVLHNLKIEGVVEELFDVAVLPGVMRPMALGFKTDEIRHHIKVGDGPLTNEGE